MRKKIVFIIVSLIFFNLTSSLFAKTLSSGFDVYDFDAFALEQTQKTFSSTLSTLSGSCCTNSQDASSAYEFLFSCRSDINLQSSFSINFNNIKMQPFFSRGCISKLNLFYRQNETVFLDVGLSKYKINLNSYIAVAVFDNGVNTIL